MVTLPTFTYKKPVGGRTRSGTQRYTTKQAKSSYQEKTILTRPIYRNVIDRRKWKAKPAPTHWPQHLTWPDDIFQALLYRTPTTPKKTPSSDSKKEKPPRLITPLPSCHGTTCLNPDLQSRNPDHLCKCTTATWSYRNTSIWFSKNISLVWTPARGIGAISRTALPADTVIGEYNGEVLPLCSRFPKDSGTYLFNVEREEDGEAVAYLDSLRVGSWTRFINHSCRPNVVFEMMRVGREMRVVIVTVRKVRVGEEVLVHYGPEYWAGLERKGVFCGCGEGRC
ncbi:SET domain-containing protein, partial [Decorospora gaudefroyi]